MNMDIVSETENKLLNRTEIKAIVSFEDRTPSRGEIVKLVAAKKNVPEKLVIVDEINQKFGQRIADVSIKIYESESVLKRLEPKYIIEKHKKALEEKKETEKVEEKEKEGNGGEGEEKEGADEKETSKNEEKEG